LVGDAGVVMDPITAQGIGNALGDAELLADAIAAGFDRGRPFDASLADHQRRRDAAIGPMYDFTTDLAAFNPPRPADQQLLAALHGRQAEIDRFLGVFAGVTPIREYRSLGNVLPLLGVNGLAKITAATVGAGLRSFCLRPLITEHPEHEQSANAGSETSASSR
jgi:hypothetical protein